MGFRAQLTPGRCWLGPDMGSSATAGPSADGAPISNCSVVSSMALRAARESVLRLETSRPGLGLLEKYDTIINSGETLSACFGSESMCLRVDLR